MFKNTKFYLWNLIYKITLEIVYYLYVSPNYSYSGLTWNPNSYKLVFSYLTFIFLLFITPKDQKRPSNQLIQLFFLTTIVPLLSIYWQRGEEWNYIFLVSTCYFILSMLLRYFRPIGKKDVNKSKKMLNIADIIFGISIIILVVYTIGYGTIDKRAFDFEQIYQLRAETQYIGIWGYLVNWLGKLLLPFCIVVYMNNKNKLMFIISCLLQIYFYLCTGHKTILFSVFLIIGSYYLLKQNRWKTGISKLYTIFILIDSIYYILTGNLIALAMIPIRLLNIPAMISFDHYNFFSVNPKLCFSEGIIGKIFKIDSPYQINSMLLVSRTGANANTGYLANAYDNGGFFIMLIFTIVFAIILLYVDFISVNSKERYKYTALMVYPVIILNDTSLLTTLLTSGMGIIIILLYILRREERTYERQNTRKRSLLKKDNRFSKVLL